MEVVHKISRKITQEAKRAPSRAQISDFDWILPQNWFEKSPITIVGARWRPLGSFWGAFLSFCLPQTRPKSFQTNSYPNKGKKSSNGRIKSIFSKIFRQKVKADFGRVIDGGGLHCQPIWDATGMPKPRKFDFFAWLPHFPQNFNEMT